MSDFLIARGFLRGESLGDLEKHYKLNLRTQRHRLRIEGDELVVLPWDVLARRVGKLVFVNARPPPGSNRVVLNRWRTLQSVLAYEPHGTYVSVDFDALYRYGVSSHFGDLSVVDIALDRIAYAWRQCRRSTCDIDASDVRREGSRHAHRVERRISGEVLLYEAAMDLYYLAGFDPSGDPRTPEPYAWCLGGLPPEIRRAEHRRAEKALQWALPKGATPEMPRFDAWVFVPEPEMVVTPPYGPNAALYRHHRIHETDAHASRLYYNGAGRNYVSGPVSARGRATRHLARGVWHRLDHVGCLPPKYVAGERHRVEGTRKETWTHEDPNP